MRTIPARFKLMGHDVTVSWRADLLATEDAYGLCHFAQQRIELQEPSEAHPISASHLMQTFLHEFFHLAFYVLGRTDMAMDEELVDQLGQVVHQMLKTKSNK